MWRLFFFAALAWAAAAEPYTLPQALASGSFLESTNDVLAVVAPMIDPQLKLAARAALTFSDYKRTQDTLASIFRRTATHKVVEARRVLAFRIALDVTASDDVGAVTDFMATWASKTFGSSRTDVLVTKKKNTDLYNVTIAAPRDGIWESGFARSPNLALALVGNDDPQCLTTLNAKNSLNGCGGLCKQFDGKQGGTVTSPGGTPCPQNIVSKQMGYRYGIDFFSTFSTANGVTVQRLQDTENYMPGTTLQFEIPRPLPEPSDINRLPVLAATFGASAVVIAILVYVQYNNRAKND